MTAAHLVRAPSKKVHRVESIDGVPVLTRPPKKRRFVATPARITNSSALDRYTSPEITAPCLRPHADDSLALPSRVGDFLHYRDGRVTDMEGNPQ